MNDPTWVSILPPLLAIGLAIASRQVYLSLAAGLWLGWTILHDWHFGTGLMRTVESTAEVLNDTGNAMVIMFTLVMGALIATVSASGGVTGFVTALERRKWVTGGRGAQLLAWVIGVVIFIESNLTVLVAGSVSRPLFDRYRKSREKLAYLIDSTSAPICILIPLNAWGAYNLALLAESGVPEGDTLGIFVRSIIFNFYAFAAVLLALAVILFKLDWGPMKKAEARAAKGEVLWPDATPMMDEGVLEQKEEAPIPARAANMIVPIVVLIAMMPVVLYLTRSERHPFGIGSMAVLCASLSGLAAAWIMMLVQKAYRIDDLVRIALRGAGGLVPLAVILILALALGGMTRDLGTGDYVAAIAHDVLSPAVFLPLVFVVSSVIAFSIGSSWGTFGIMIPIVVPAAAALGLDLSPFLAAALAGGIFGDHCSPISDTTIISSMAAATDHVDHVRTQLPYALVAGGVATVCFAVVGVFL